MKRRFEFQEPSFLLIYTFYFWLYWVFVAAQAFVVGNRGYPLETVQELLTVVASLMVGPGL